MKLEIEPLTLRSATWLAANMRPQDEAELMCQLPPGTSRSDAGAACFFTSGDGWKWQAIIDGSPVACFGVSQLTYTTWVGWGFGRPQMRRAMPEVTRFLKAQLPRLIEAGCRRIEPGRSRATRGRTCGWRRSVVHTASIWATGAATVRSSSFGAGSLLNG